MPKALNAALNSTTSRRPARSRVVSRLWNTAERQVEEIEARLKAGADAATLERDAKTFAIIARTVRDLVALDAEAQAQAHTNRKEKRPTHGPEDDANPADPGSESIGARDIEDFRAELARRLDALRAERAGEPTA